MSKKVIQPESSAQALSVPKKTCKDNSRQLQVELVKLQRHFIEQIKGAGLDNFTNTYRTWPVLSALRTRHISPDLN